MGFRSASRFFPFFLELLEAGRGSHSPLPQSHIRPYLNMLFNLLGFVQSGDKEHLGENLGTFVRGGPGSLTFLPNKSFNLWGFNLGTKGISGHLGGLGDRGLGALGTVPRKNTHESNGSYNVASSASWKLRCKGCYSTQRVLEVTWNGCCNAASRPSWKLVHMDLTT